MDVNTLSIIGRLTKKAELGYTSTGTACVKFSIAVNRIKRKGEEEAAVDFFNVTLWGKQGERIASYLDKGKQVAIEGRLQQDRWTDTQTGNKRQAVSIVANNVQLLGGAMTGNDREPANYAPSYQDDYQVDYQVDAGFPEEIPF